MGAALNGRARPRWSQGLILVVLTAVVALPLPALADPAPADSGAMAAELGAGWLARQVTSAGDVVGSDATADFTDTAWATLGMLAGGWGRTAVVRSSARMVSAVDARGVDELTVSELALLTLVLTSLQADPRLVGDGEQDLVAALVGRTQPGGVDEGLIGPSSPLQAPVASHSLALLALRAAGAPDDDRHVDWLRAQQCPGGGWPVYRDAASRSTGTCELLVATMEPTTLAVVALTGVGAAPANDTQQFLRASAGLDGGFGPAPGLPTTPPDTALGVLALTALSGGPPDESWEGSRGRPQDVLLAEQLGCAWHGRDRGAVPAEMRDGVDPGPGLAGEDDPPAPGQATDAAEVAVAVMAWAGSLVATPGATPVTGDPFPACPLTTTRAEGTSRISTAVALSQTAFPDGADVVVVATAGAYADALAATALAGSLGAPILLSQPEAVPAEVRSEVQRLGAAEVVLMGGSAALSTAVEEEFAAVEGVGSVRRIAGATRFETAVAAADEVGGDRVFLARGAGPMAQAPWADALAVGAWAATRGIPVLLTTPEALPPSTQEALEGRSQVTVVGGTSAVSAAVADEVAALGPAVDRIAGRTRVETSALALSAAFADGVDARVVGLATSRDFPDALAAGPALAALGGTLLLIDPGAGMTATASREALLDLDYLVDAFIAAGGTANLPDGVLADAAVLVREGAGG